MTDAIREPTRKDLRVYGLMMGAILGGVGYLLWRKGVVWAWALLALAGFFFAMGLVLPGALDPVWRRWMRFAGILAAINTFLVMGLMYFLVFTPYSVFMRILGRRTLEESWEDVPSYWRDHDAPGEPKAYERQF